MRGSARPRRIRFASRTATRIARAATRDSASGSYHIRGCRAAVTTSVAVVIFSALPGDDEADLLIDIVDPA